METLSMIGITVAFVSIVLGGLYYWKGLDNSRRIYYALAFLTVVIFVVTPFLRQLIGEAATNAFYDGDYIFAFFAMPLASGLMPIFPHLAYGFLGAMLGIAIARGENSRRVLLTLLIFAGSLLVVGILNYGTYQGLPGMEPFT